MVGTFTGADNKEYYDVDGNAFTYMPINATKAQQQTIEDLQGTVEKLEANNAIQQAQLNEVDELKAEAVETKEELNKMKKDMEALKQLMSSRAVEK